MKKILLLLLISVSAFAQTENVFLITTDGFRWQELFGGVDTTLLNNTKFVRNKNRIVQTFVGENKIESRKKIMPFFWNTIATQGQIYGNRWEDNWVNVLNPYWFSYPGYNEILTGFADDSVNSNNKKYNENITVLEFLNNQSSLKGKIAAYTTWDVFPYIINDKRSGILVNSGKEPTHGKLTAKEELLNDIMATYPSLASDRHDFITNYLAFEYIKKNKPKVFFLAFDETDEFGHEAKYDEYLFAANTFDKFVANLWNYCQNTPEYKDKTTFIITTDHGRGDRVKNQWTSHGTKVSDCYQIWLAAIGPNTSALGEMKGDNIINQNQIAATVAKLLGFDFQNGKPIGKPIPSILK